MGITEIRRTVVASVLLLALVGVLGCSAAQSAVPATGDQISEDYMVMVDGLLPPWDLDDMVKQADAIVMGTLKAELGTKEAPGGVSDPPKFNYEFTDYRLEVSKALHPKDALADFIAVMAETGAVPVGDNVHVLSDADVPECEVGDEVILFLRSLADEDNYDDDIGRPVPDGFDNDDYFIVMVGGLREDCERRRWLA